MTIALRPSFRAESPWTDGRMRQPDPAEVAPRWAAEYICPRGHVFEVPFAADVEEIPPVWRCSRHGVDSHQPGRQDTPPPKPKQGDKRLMGDTDGRTHLDRLYERRSIPQLEALLDERLNDLARCRRAGVPPEPAPKGTNPGRLYS